MDMIKCEMCGSNQFIKIDGLYQCQHCGTKYTKEEAQKLLVSVSGTVKVEIVKGEDEKNRLIKKINTELKLGNKRNAYGICQKIIDDYPEELEFYYLKLDLAFDLIDKMYSYDETINLRKFKNNYFDVFGFIVFKHKSNCRYMYGFEQENCYYSDEINKTIDIIKKLSSDNSLLDSKLLKYKKNDYPQSILSRIENGELLLFDELLMNRYKTYIPIALANYVNTYSREYAKSVMRLISTDKPFLKGLLRNHHKKLVDAEHFCGPDEIEELLYLTPREGIVMGIGYFNNKPVSFPNIIFFSESNRSIEDAKNEILRLVNDRKKHEAYLDEVEPRSKRLFERIKSITDYKVLEDIYQKYAVKSLYHNPEHKMHPRSDYEKTVISIQSVVFSRKYENFTVNINYDNSVTQYTKRIQNFKYSMSLPISSLDALENYLSNLYRTSGVCSYCGGAFKGLLNKKCSECGKPKNY